MTVLRLRNQPIAQFLLLEQQLLQKEQGAILLINEGTLPAIVLGCSNKETEWLHQTVPLPIVRRCTGGGAVVVDEQTLFVSWIFDRKEGLSHSEELLSWTTELYQKAHPFLPFSRKNQDYAIGDCKIGGNALYFKKSRALQHTSFLFDYLPERMSCLKMPPTSPPYRNGRTHDQFLSKLSGYFPSMSAFIDPFIEVAREAWPSISSV